MREPAAPDTWAQQRISGAAPAAPRPLHAPGCLISRLSRLAGCAPPPVRLCFTEQQLAAQVTGAAPQLGLLVGCCCGV